MKWPEVPVAAFCRTGSGGTPSRAKQDEYFGGTIPWVKSGELLDVPLSATEEQITPTALSESSAKLVPPGAVLIAMYGATVGRTALLEIEAATNQAVCFLIPDKRLADNRYLWFALRACYNDLLAKRVGGAQPNISQQIIRAIRLPLPPLSEQRHIVEILDDADRLRKLRREADAKAERILPALFFRMFGDPAMNPKRWRAMPLRNAASKYSDGPFGSNLKSEHYVPVGVRVVRLQNIGVGVFLDSDKAYISEEHFASLVKYECRPGDVLIATLGDPNLRACIQPESLPIALNKADCVQLRVSEHIAVAEYICCLLNLPSTLSMARSLVLGQTRTRISMGRLGALVVPVPPADLQRRFAAKSRTVTGLLLDASKIGWELERLYKLVLHRAFSAELTAKWRDAHMKELIAEMEQQAKLLSLPMPSIERLAARA